MKTNKFKNVKVNDTIIFHNNGMIETAAIYEVKKRTFHARQLKAWDKNGVLCYNDILYHFFKTGKKAHPNYNYGDAIEITGTL